MIGLISLFDWWDDALEFGVVETLDRGGELGLVSFDVPDLLSLFTCAISPELELLVTFCWANLSCLRNFARLFWNHTWNKSERGFSIIWFDCENLIKCEWHVTTIGTLMGVSTSFFPFLGKVWRVTSKVQQQKI